jgi:hypothetical protein
VLEVRDFEEYGFIYLVHGRVEAISLPITDEKLGSRLVRAGLLSEQRLGELLLEDAAMTKEERMHKPLGQRLIERGYADEKAIREIMAQQTQDQVFELAHWQNGVFSYSEPDQMPEFHVRIEADVQALLLDAYRRIDEGETARKAAYVEQDEVCYACPTQDTCTPAKRRRYLKSELCLWRELAAIRDEEFEKVRQASQLYRSRHSGDRPELEALVDNAAYVSSILRSATVRDNGHESPLKSWADPDE